MIGIPFCFDIKREDGDRNAAKGSKEPAREITTKRKISLAEKSRLNLLMGGVYEKRNYFFLFPGESLTRHHFRSKSFKARK